MTLGVIRVPLPQTRVYQLTWNSINQTFYPHNQKQLKTVVVVENLAQESMINAQHIPIKNIGKCSQSRRVMANSAAARNEKNKTIEMPNIRYILLGQ